MNWNQYTAAKALILDILADGDAHGDNATMVRQWITLERADQWRRELEEEGRAAAV